MKIAVVLVTYNRLADLKIALEKYEAQKSLPAYIVVVNNASTDGTDVYLQEWKKQESKFEKLIVSSEKNLGGSGGFYLGVEKASTLDCDFMFLADDDAFADPEMLHRLEEYYEKTACKDEIAALCTSVINHGTWGLGHRARIVKSRMKIHYEGVPAAEYSKEAFPVDILSFVGAVIKKETVLKIGLPIKEYFIYHDDTEYSIQVGKQGKIMCVPQSIMYHDSPLDGRITWKEYYAVRNHINMLKRHFPMRYYAYLALYYFIKRGYLLPDLTRAQKRLYRRAVLDGIRGKLGISSIYKPGIDIEKLG